jgi:hypothetical protein
MADTKPTGISNFERFFRVAASLDVDKDDLKRYREFVAQKLNDLLVRGHAIAKANGRDVVEPFDVPPSLTGRRTSCPATRPGRSSPMSKAA